MSRSQKRSELIQESYFYGGHHLDRDIDDSSDREKRLHDQRAKQWNKISKAKRLLDLKIRSIVQLNGSGNSLNVSKQFSLRRDARNLANGLREEYGRLRTLYFHSSRGAAPRKGLRLDDELQAIEKSLAAVKIFYTSEGIYVLG